MKNASREFMDMVYSGNKQYLGKAHITLANGTELFIDNSDIWEDGIQIIEQTSNSGSFDLGFCACDQLIFKIKNIEGKYSNYNFNNAVIRPQTGLQLSETVEYLKCGVYTVDLPQSVGSYISLSCIDNMYKLDRKILNLGGTVVGVLVYNIAIACGVTLKTANFDGYDRTVTLPDNITELTYRQALSFICQTIGAFARFDGDGLLEIKWYDTGAFETSDRLDGGYFDYTIETSYQSGDSADGGNFTDYNSGDSIDGGTFLDMDRYHHIYSLQSLNVATDDVVITGIRVTNGEATYLFGTEEYALGITDNPFTVGKEQEIATYLGNKIVGMRFRPLTVTARSNPLIEAGDPAYVSDRKGNYYQCYITNYNFVIRQNMQLACDAASPQANSAEGLNASTELTRKARRVAQEEISAYDQVVQQFTNLMTYGFGLHKSEEKLEDGSTIYYMHDKPKREESNAIWKFGSNGLVLSTDQGVTWGVDTNGNMLVKVLTAIGVNAEWIKVLTSFTVGANFSVDSYGRLVARLVDISGKITATSGKIGAFLIDEYGIESEVVRITENPLFPGIRLRKKGDSGKHVNDKDNNSREMDMQSGYVLFETINNGVKTEVRLVSKSDSFTSDAGLVISKVDVSGEFEKTISYVELSIGEGASLKMFNYSGGVFENSIELGGDTLTFQNYSGHTGNITFTSDNSLTISVPNDVYIGGASINNILERLDELERRI